MVSITIGGFNEYIDEFQQLLVENIVSIDGLLLLVVNSYVRSAGVQQQRYVYTRCCLDGQTYFDFTVSFDTFFTVPVLYFKIYSFSDVTAREVFDISGLKYVGSSTFTIESHHLLNSPWFYVHPCETASTMTDFMGALDQDGNIYDRRFILKYLCSWFGIYISSVVPGLSFRPNLTRI